MLGLGFLNLAIIALYLAGVTFLGVWAIRKVHGMGDFIMPRRFGKWMLTMHAFGSGTHSDQAVSVASKSYTDGLSGIWYQWLYLFGTPFYWLIAPMMRRFRALTTADIFELRFNPSVAVLYSLISIAMMATTIGLMLKGSGAVISGASNGAISPGTAIAVMTVLFVIYGSAGGLAGAIITDFVQGILTVVFSFLLLPFVLEAVGGLDGMRETISDPAMFSLVAPAGIGVFYISMIAINGLVGIVTQPHILANCAAGRTEADGQVGFVAGSFLKRFCTVAWSLTGLAGVAFFAGQEIEPDHLYGLLAHAFFPEILPGLLGLFIATLLASVMSSCDSFMIAGSALFTENIYKRARPDCSKQHYLLVARVASVGVVVLGVGYAYWLDGVIQGLYILWKIGPMMGIAFWLGFFWRGFTPAAAWVSTLGALGVWWLSAQGFFIDWLAGHAWAQSMKLVEVAGDGYKVHLPWQMVGYLTTGLLLGLVTSFFTKPTGAEKLDRYHALARTPVGPAEIPTDTPCVLPQGVEPAPRRSLFPVSTGIEISIPSRRAVIGFVIGWICVGAIIALVYAIAVG
jgi:Na+/proline symporter